MIWPLDSTVGGSVPRDESAFFNFDMRAPICILSSKRPAVDLAPVSLALKDCCLHRVLVQSVLAKSSLVQMKLAPAYFCLDDYWAKLKPFGTSIPATPQIADALMSAFRKCFAATAPVLCPVNEGTIEFEFFDELVSECRSYNS